VSVLSHIKSAVIVSTFLSVYLFGYRYLGDGDTDRREILHDGPGHKVSRLRDTLKGPKNPKF